MPLTYVISGALLLTAESSAAIKNVSRVSDTIARGGRPTTSEDYNYLAEAGFKTVICLQGGDGIFGSFLTIAAPGEHERSIATERKLVRERGMRFLNFRMAPWTSFLPIDRMTAASIDKALRALTNPKLLPIFIHCEFGCDRTGLVIALHRVINEGWTIQAARNEWIKQGHRGLNGLMTRALDPYFESRSQIFNERRMHRSLACRDAF